MDGEPPQEEDFSQIPLVDRSTHKNWKARLSAYNDVISKAGKTASDTDPFFRPFVNDGALLKKWCLDANAVAQEKGIEAVLAIVTNSGETSSARFVGHVGRAHRLRPEIVPALVEKALGNTRAGTRKKGTDVCLMFVEVENGGEGVIGDVIAGLAAKAPKTVAGAAACLKEVAEAFGVPQLGNVKLLLKVLPKIFAHSDKNVRAEGTGLTLALYTYLGPALLPALADLKPVQMTDLQKSFDSLDAEGKGKGTGKPARWTRKAQREREEAADGGGDDDGGAEEEAVEIDPLSLLDPVDVSKLFPDNVMELLGSSKWKERLEACEECNKVLAEPKNARVLDTNVEVYGPLVQTLGTKCHKDANVNVVMEAAKLLENLAHGLGKPFGRYRGVTMTGCLERLKERKAAVVEALGKALDAIFLTTTLQDIVEDVLTALKSKNPQVKEGTLSFLHRSLRVTLDAPGKDQVKPMAEALVALLGDGAEPVRAAAAECLGTLMKILGERAFNPYVEGIPEIQLAKVKDALGRAEIRYKVGGPKKAPPKAATAAKAPTARAPVKKPASPVKGSSGGGELLDAFEAPKRGPPARFAAKQATPPADDLLDEVAAPPKRAPPARFAAKMAAAAAPADELLDEVAAPPKRGPPARLMRKAAPADSSPDATPPPSSPTKAPPRAASAARPPPAAAGPSKPAPKAGGGGGAKTLASSPTDPIKYRFSPEEAAARAEEAIPANYHTAFADAAWKVRLEAADEMVAWIGEGGGAEQVDSEVMMRFLGKKPGWGEKNFQVSGKLYQVMQLMAERNPSFGKPAASLIIGPLTDKLGDMKLKKPSGDALAAVAEKTSLAFVLAQSYEPMTKQKAPKAQADALTWIKQQVIDFGISGIPLRDLITFVKAALGSPNAMVRSSATALLVQIKIGVGADISGFIEDLNPTLLTTINKEFDKVADHVAPDPTREQADLRDAAPAGGKGGKGGGADPLDDIIPRVDLDKLVNQTSVINDSRNEAWKVRKEAFEALAALLEVKSNSRLKPNMGEIGTVLKKAMADTNLSVKMLALGIISKIATGMGSPFDKYSRVVVAAVASVCADQKAATRGAAVNTLSAIADACGSLDSMYTGLASSLESTNPALRSSVLGWVGDRLAVDPPGRSADMGPLAAPVISCLEDRNGDVRKAAQAVLPFVVQNAGFDHVMDQTSSLKPASRATILPLIQNARGAAAANEPATPAPPPKAPARAGSVRAPAKGPATPAAARAAPTSALPKPGAGRSIAMKALGSAPSTRPTSSMSDDRPTGIAKSRIAGPGVSRTTSNSTSASVPVSASGRTLPFVSAAPEARTQRLKRDAARWSLETAARSDMLDYLHQQMEAHASPEVLSQLFSKDHRSEEDFMAALSTVADFYDAESCGSFGLPEDEMLAVQLANVDLALKYAALRLLSNNTQLANRCLEVITNVLETLSRSGDRLNEVEVKLFVPALVIKLGDSKFGAKLAPIFEGLDKLIPASQVVQLLVQYGLEDKGAGKTCKNESLQLIEKAYRKRGSVLRKDDRAFFEAVAKCIADQGTRQSALTLMALLQLQGESRALQAVIGAMPQSSKDMLANRRATLAASKAGAAVASSARGPASDSDSMSPGSQSPRPKIPASGIATPGAKRLSRDLPSGATTPGHASRPASRGLPAPSTSRLPGATTPARGIPAPAGSTLPRPMSVASNASSATVIPGPKRTTSRLPHPESMGGPPTAPLPMLPPPVPAPRPSMQPLGRLPAAPAQMSEAALTIEAIRTNDVDEAAEALKATAMLLEEDEDAFIPDAGALLDALCYQLDLHTDSLLEPATLRRVKHLMRTIHVAFGRPRLVRKFRLEGLERLFVGIRHHYGTLEVWAETAGEDNQPANDLRDYMSMVLSSSISSPSRELVYTMLFDSLAELCKDMTPNQDPRVAPEIGVVLQCTYKRVRSIDADLRNNRIDAGTLLAIIENLLQIIPPVQWRRRPKYGLPHGDLPLRVIKTLLQRVIVFTKEIGIGIYDLLQEQFGAEADMTTVYSYIFRISSATDDAAASTPTSATVPEPPAPIARRTNGERPVSERLERFERPLSIASSAGTRTSVVLPDTMTIKSPARDVPEAERLVRRLTDTRDSEQRLNELHAFMKINPENEAEARAAISAILNPAVAKFVWRALDRRSGEGAAPTSPGPSSPSRSPVRDMYSPPLSNVNRQSFGADPSAPPPMTRPALAPRPASMVANPAPVDDKLAALNAMFRNRTRNSGASAGSGGGSGSSSPVGPGRPLSDIERERGERISPRPFSEIVRPLSPRAEM